MKTPDSRAHVCFCSLFFTEACLDADHKVNIFINICSIRNARKVNMYELRLISLSGTLNFS